MDGLKNDTLCVIIFAFLLAGILSQELRQSGLIQGLTWLVMKLGLSAGFLPLVAFLVCLLISTACGTSNGAIVAVLPVLLPVAASVGANPSVVVGAIVSGAIFGDNLAPISDTTIASALTQDAEVRDVVRTRLPYSLIARHFRRAVHHRRYQDVHVR
ncbi:Na+/H+ antiporter NhaC, partial [human gut metagenome]